MRPPQNNFARSARRLRRHLVSERGQALVEFAIVLPILMLIIVGILTFGRYENYASQETQMAGVAARYASVNVNPSSTVTLQAYVRSEATGELLNGSTDVTTAVQVYFYYPTGSSNVVGNPVRACVIATVRLLPMLDSGPSATIVETATSRIEAAATNWATTNNPTAVPAACPLT